MSRNHVGMRLLPIHARAFEVAGRVARCVEQVVAPNDCVFCGGALPLRTAPVCAGCHADLPWSGPRFHLEPFVAALAPLDYAFPVDAAIKRFKFRRKLFYAPAFVHLLAAAVAALPDDVDGLLPMPLHWRRQALRGFNQAHEISRGIARTAALPLVRGVARSRHTPRQSGLPAASRRRNMRRAFRARGSIDFRHVLIVDDVITTGESCRALARAVLEAGAGKVSALAIARATPG